MDPLLFMVSSRNSRNTYLHLELSYADKESAAFSLHVGKEKLTNKNQNKQKLNSNQKTNL